MNDALIRDTDPLAWAKHIGTGALAEKMGLEWVEFSRERAVATMPVEGNTQPVGLFHGGAYVVLAESMGSTHANLLVGPDRLALGVDVNATHTRAARSGLVTGICVPLHVGRTMTVHEIVLTDDEGRRCSTVRITNTVVQRPGF